MKNQFIEKDGKLFLKCEPEPLTKDSVMPCLVTLTKHGIMGEFNKDMHGGQLKDIHVCDFLEILHSRVVSNTYSKSHYQQYEIIAKHCPEGSKEWALWQMLNGNMVTINSKIWSTNKFKVCDNDVYYYGLSGSWITLYPIVEWLTNAARIGWEICEEPKREPEVGKWYQQRNKHVSLLEYIQCMRVESDYAVFREAGRLQTQTIRIASRGYCELVEVSLTPDFSNAKVGDECYDTIDGVSKISQVREFKYGEIVVNTTLGVGYLANGKESKNNANPGLFHSVEQCAAYFAEVALNNKKTINNESQK